MGQSSDGNRTSPLTAWRASFTRRWHSNPDMCDVFDPNSAHQGRCVILLVKLFPGCTLEQLKAIATHDLGERFAGDLSRTVKRQHPEVAAAHAEVENVELTGMGFEYMLTEKERKQNKLVDSLDAYLFTRHHKPEILTGDGWPEHKELILKTAQELGVYEAVTFGLLVHG